MLQFCSSVKICQHFISKHASVNVFFLTFSAVLLTFFTAKTQIQALKYMAISTGMTASDTEKLRAVLDAIPELGYICLDVANGYSEHFVDYIRKVLNFT